MHGDALVRYPANGKEVLNYRDIDYIKSIEICRDEVPYIHLVIESGQTRYSPRTAVSKIGIFIAKQEKEKTIQRKSLGHSLITFELVKR